MEYEIKYKILTNYLKSFLKNGEYLSESNIRKILEVLEVEIDEKENEINE